MKIEGSIHTPIGPTALPAPNLGSAPSARPTPDGPAIDDTATAAAVGRAEKSGQPPTDGSRSALGLWGRMLSETLDTMIDEETQRLRGLVAKVYSDMARLAANLPATEAGDDAEAGAAGGGVDSSI